MGIPVFELSLAPTQGQDHAPSLDVPGGWSVFRVSTELAPSWLTTVRLGPPGGDVLAGTAAIHRLDHSPTYWLESRFPESFVIRARSEQEPARADRDHRARCSPLRRSHRIVAQRGLQSVHRPWLARPQREVIKAIADRALRSIGSALNGT